MLGLNVAGEGPRLGGVLRVGARQTDEECQSGRQAVGVLGKGRTSLHLITVSWSTLYSAPCLSGREDEDASLPVGGHDSVQLEEVVGQGLVVDDPGDLGQRGEGVFVVDHGLADPDGDVFVAGVGQ